MNNVADQLVAGYIACWNETDPLRRRNLIEDIFAEHATYIDPMVESKGWEAIDATIAAVQGMFPQHRFVLAGTVDAHHDTMRFGWQLSAPDADEPLVIGFDVAILEKGRICHVYGFLDKVPVLA